MRNKKIIIIGMGTAASGAAAAVNHTNPKAEVSIIEKRGYEMYSPCGMPFAFEGRLDFRSLKHDFPARGPRTKLYLNTEEVTIDPDRKEAVIKNQEGQNIFQYDSLIIATGARPIIPPIENIERFLGRYAHTLYTLEEVSRLYKIASQDSNISIIGAGAIGVEFCNGNEKAGLRGHNCRNDGAGVSECVR